jgi:FAD-dependent urate hydroxylase
VTKVPVAIIGAGPYGLSLAAHLAARNVEHRIFGRPMQFWSQVADAGGDRNLRTYCFGTNISTPAPGFSFPDYSRPRGLETFEPCSINDFARYGNWFQQLNVPWVEPVDVAHVVRNSDGFAVKLADGRSLDAERVMIAIGLTCFAQMPRAVAALPPAVARHTSEITSFADFKGKDVAVVGAGQSALEAAALLLEAGARPQLLVRKDAIYWMNRVPQSRNLWRRLRSPISALGSGPKAWALAHFPGAMHRLPEKWRTHLVKKHLPPEGAWWLRERVENRMPVHVSTTIEEACEADDRVSLRLRGANASKERNLLVDHVIAGTGYDIDVERFVFLDPALRAAIRRIGRAPKLNAAFETSVPGLGIIGPASAISFGPLFRFVAGAEYTARVVSAHVTSRSLVTDENWAQIASKTQKS